MKSRNSVVSAKLLCCALFILIGTGRASGQQWKVMIGVAENGTVQDSLVLGINNSATDGIDAQHGEAQLPPLPPFGVLDVRFTNQSGDLGLGVKHDIRRADVGQKIYTIEFKRSASQNTVTLSWNSLPPGEFILQDKFGGILINQAMTASGEITITEPLLDTVKLFVTPTYIPPDITNSSLNDALVGIPYHVPVAIGNLESNGWYAYEIISGPTWMTVTESGVLTGTPATVDEGTDVVAEIKVTDHRGLSDMLTGSFDVLNELTQVGELREIIVSEEESAIVLSYTDDASLNISVTNPQGGDETLTLNRVSDTAPVFQGVPLFNRNLFYYDITTSDDLFSAEITFAYTDQLLQASGIGETDLTVTFYDSLDARGFIWHTPEYTIDTALNTISVTTDHFSIWAVTDRNEQIITGIEESGSTTAGSPPHEFALAQNYPNPFNPTTTIGFSLSLSAPVSLKTYDVLGREVATLVNSIMPNGNHQIVWNGTNSSGSSVASGIYIYRMRSTDGLATSRRMLMVKYRMTNHVV